MGLHLPSCSFSPIISFLDPANTSSPLSSSHLLTVRSQVGPAVARTEQGDRAGGHSSPSLTPPTPEANSGPCNPQSPAPSSLEILFYAASHASVYSMFPDMTFFFLIICFALPGELASHLLPQSPAHLTLQRDASLVSHSGHVTQSRTTFLLCTTAECPGLL